MPNARFFLEIKLRFFFFQDFSLFLSRVSSFFSSNYARFVRLMPALVVALWQYDLTRRAF